MCTWRGGRGNGFRFCGLRVAFSGRLFSGNKIPPAENAVMPSGNEADCLCLFVQTQGIPQGGSSWGCRGKSPVDPSGDPPGDPLGEPPEDSPGLPLEDPPRVFVAVILWESCVGSGNLFFFDAVFFLKDIWATSHSPRSHQQVYGPWPLRTSEPNGAVHDRRRLCEGVP